jgi:hypothetical protein
MTQRALPISLAVGTAGLLICLVGLFLNADHFFRAYLWAWLFCLGAALGSMSIVMLHHLTGGEWGFLVRRPAEAAAMTLPLLLVLFIPIAFGVHHLFPWAKPDRVASEALLQHRKPLFTTAFTLIRSFVYLLIWCLWAWRLSALSLRHDDTGDPAPLITVRRLSGLGFVVYFATMSLAAMDWIVSREVDWYSSTFGLLTIVGQSATGIAFLIVVLALLRRTSPMRDVITPDRVHDLGNLLLTCVVLWSYISFAQFLVIWMGNTQEDIVWFIHRTHGGWWWVSLALILLHFAAPFVLLLFQRAKRDPRALAMIAAGVLLMRAVDNLWMVAPTGPTHDPGPLYWLDFVTPFGVGGIWFAYFLWLLARHPLIPLGHRVPVDPLIYGTTDAPRSIA